jgi:3-phenylpropionate/trans-cinnamate dioxygenase ferredoxin reductase subunit
MRRGDDPSAGAHLHRQRVARVFGMSLVIVGAGQAAHQLAASLRERGYDAPVLIVGDEKHLPYHRPPLSKAYLTEPMDADRLTIASRSFYDGANITARLDCRVSGIDRESRQIVTAAGERIDYTKLVLATGSRNRVIEAFERVQGVFSVRRIDEAALLRAQLDEARQVVVIGGGLLGLEFACAARERRCDVVVIEAGHRVLARTLSTVTAARMHAHHEHAGIRFRVCASVAECLSTDGRVTGVLCLDGERIPADLVVVSIGIVPNAELAADAGLDVADGILVDQHYRTSDPTIHAIGDCARIVLSTDRGSVRHESVQNAIDQANGLARYLTEPGYVPGDLLPMFWSKQGKIMVNVVGRTVDSSDAIDFVVGDDGYCRLCFTGGELTGAECVNSMRQYRHVRRLLERGNRATLDQFGGGRTPAEIVATW